MCNTPTSPKPYEIWEMIQAAVVQGKKGEKKGARRNVGSKSVKIKVFEQCLILGQCPGCKKGELA